MSETEKPVFYDLRVTCTFLIVVVLPCHMLGHFSHFAIKTSKEKFTFLLRDVFDHPKSTTRLHVPMSCCFLLSVLPVLTNAREKLCEEACLFYYKLPPAPLVPGQRTCTHDPSLSCYGARESLCPRSHLALVASYHARAQLHPLQPGLSAGSSCATSHTWPGDSVRLGNEKLI